MFIYRISFMMLWAFWVGVYLSGKLLKKKENNSVLTLTTILLMNKHSQKSIDKCGEISKGIFYMSNCKAHFQSLCENLCCLCYGLSKLIKK